MEFIVKIRNRLLPIEVKYKSQVRKKNLNGLLNLMERFNVNKGILITKDLFDKQDIDGEEILFIPAWLFLLSEI